MNNTNTIKEIRDGVYALLLSKTGTGQALAGCAKYHVVGPDKFPFASVEPGEITASELLTNVEILRPYGFDILVQYPVPSDEETNGVPSIQYAWDSCMTAAQAVMDALDTATNLGLSGVAQITPAKPRAGKALVGDGLVVYYLIEVAIWTVFDKV